ncbi:uncharacterized protein LOC62_03G004664 [Vanrija pseudolonga]|uniref:GAR domain-containing protein n=1 Tax=Vanrija pseudolonga TaxID=143232 RepID=A0AAF1BHI0_9TREE|nr:hypothetical protein LOC62_03G004664 [Vanrija pseudolonga]
MLGSTSTGPKQDLSFADQQELLAFIEKRNWFEEKLEALKSLAPVYPFVHPILVTEPHSATGYVRQGADESQWRLPDRAQLQAWVNERDALEDEVDRFDDGDMERMKEKTRQMTRVPLTKPSTDLVEVTLDLILLIDQLLTHLRQRRAVLDLASLRLQWDDLRFEVTREAESVKGEIEHVVSEAQAWVPGMPLPDRPERRNSYRHYGYPSRYRSGLPGSTSNTSLPETASAPSTPPSPAKQSLPPSPTKATPPSHRVPGSRSPRVPGSPTKPNAPRPGLHLSILHSQIVGLQTRQRNFQYNLVKRSGAILDRMIDMAVGPARLKDLGGVDGPLKEGQDPNRGIVPDALIDLQDEIERKAEDMHDIVRWCSEFELQTRQAHEHYNASMRSQKAATDFLTEIEAALAVPASSYESKDQHNAAVVMALATARENSQVDLDLGAKALAFYASLLKAKDSLVAQNSRVEALRHQLTAIVARLDKGSDFAPRPSLVEVAQNGGDHEGWLSNVHDWIESGDVITREATDMHEATTLAVMQYRKALLGAPMAVKRFLPTSGVPDDLGPIVDDNTTDLVTLARRCAELSRAVRTDAQALPLVSRVRLDTATLAEDADTFHNTVIRAVKLAAWSSSPPAAVPTDLNDKMSAFADRADDVENDIQSVQQLVGASAPTVGPLLLSTAGRNRERLVDAYRDLASFTKVAEQSNTVRLIQTEAQDLLAAIELARGSIDNGTAEANAENVALLKAKVTGWDNALVKRVKFVSSNPPSSNDANESSRAGGGPPTPPLTPLGTEVDSSMLALPNLVALDRRVRNEVNHQSARVSSALSQLISTVRETSVKQWEEPVNQATTELNDVSDKLAEVLAGLNKHVDKAKAATLHERVELAIAARAIGADALPAPVAAVHTHITRLHKVLGANNSFNLDTHRTADIFSTADVAREAGVGRVAEAEQWQRDADKLVSDAQAAVYEDAQAKAQAVIEKKAARAAANPRSVVKTLAARLEALQLDSLVKPTSSALRTTPKHRRLPSSDIAKQISSSLESITQDANALASDPDRSDDVDMLLERLKRQNALVTQLDGLALVSDAAAHCDKAFSNLLDAIDDGHDTPAAKAAEREASITVEALQKAAEPHQADPRVSAEVDRVTNAWRELRSLAENEPYAPSSAGVSTVGSAAGSEIGRQRPPSVASARSDRTVSLPTELVSAQPEPRPNVETTPRNRASSLAEARRNRSLSVVERPVPPVAKGHETPSKLRPRPPQPRPRPSLDSSRPPPRSRPSLDSALFSPPVPRIRKTAPPNAVASSSTPKQASIVKTVPKPFNLSRSNSFTRSSRSSSFTDFGSELGVSPPTKPASTARSVRSLSSVASRSSLVSSTSHRSLHHSRSRLDVAVKRVLNTLDVDVPVVPAGPETPTSEDWKDESGCYWIGTGSRARLCFCRILRSRTVMVRVGGGWVELSRYLLDHFADALGETPEDVDKLKHQHAPAGTGEWQTAPIAITSATLAATTALSASLSASRGSDGSPRTPGRASLPLFPTDGSPHHVPAAATPDRRVSAPLPSGSSPPSAPGPGSPLVPLQFIRKASESPSVREKERERIRSRPGVHRATSLDA